MAAGGDDNSFMNLLIEWQRRLYAFILSLAPDLGDADDILQETNAVLLRKREEFAPGSDFGAWICQVAYYEVLNFRKRRQRTSRHLLLDEDLLEDLASDAQQRLVNQDHRLTALGQCLERLPEADRQLIRDRYRHNHSTQDIARREGRTAAAVRQVLYRIRGELLRCIERRLAREERS